MGQERNAIEGRNSIAIQKQRYEASVRLKVGYLAESLQVAVQRIIQLGRSVHLMLLADVTQDFWRHLHLGYFVEIECWKSFWQCRKSASA